MSDASDNAELLTLWALGLEHETPPTNDRARLMAALAAEPYLPFCAELATHVDLTAEQVRALLARCADAGAWTRATPPATGFIDFDPGPRLTPLRAGIVRLVPGGVLAAHEHLDRELTYVLEGHLIDDQQRSYGAGDVIDMSVGSRHSLSVSSEGATVVVLHGRVRSAP